MQPQPSYQPRPVSRGPQALYGRIPEPQANGWSPAVYDQPGYNAYPAPAAAYVPGQEGGYPPTQGPQPLGQPQAPYGDPGLTPAPYGAPQQQQQAVPGGYPQQPYPAQNRMSYFQQQAEAYGPSQQPQPLAQAQSQAQPQAQAQPQPQQQPQPAAQQQAEPPREAQGPPYTFDPNATYPDPNAQAWAQYYAQGGTDPTGAVYFFSVPGITDRTPVDAQSPQAQAQAQAQAQGQPQSQSQQDASAGYQQPYGQVQQQSPGAGVVSPTSGPAHSPQSAHPQTAFVQAIQQQQQQLSQPPQSQLQHQPQAQPQLQPQPQDGPQRQASASSLPSPGAYVHELPSPYGGAAAPVPGPQRQGSLGTTYAPQSPGAAAGAGPGVAGGPAAEWANQYYGLQSQFAGMSVSGQGQGGEHEGQPQAQVPAQPPVGA